MMLEWTLIFDSLLLLRDEAKPGSYLRKTTIMKSQGLEFPFTHINLLTVSGRIDGLLHDSFSLLKHWCYAHMVKRVWIGCASLSYERFGWRFIYYKNISLPCHVREKFSLNIS